ncbi:MAG: hypothetical protein R2813_09405 [Flavobacteriales bacterium]
MRLGIGKLFSFNMLWYVYMAILLNLFVSFLFFRTPFDFYIGYLAFIFLLPLFLFKFGVPREIGLIFGVLLLVGVVQSVIGNNEFPEFVQVFVGAFASYLLFYHLVFNTGTSLQSLFELYLKGAFLCAIVGLFQLASYMVGFVPGYDFAWMMSGWAMTPGGLFGIRIKTFFGEPTYHAMFLSGAMFVAIHDFIYQASRYFFSRTTALVMIAGVFVSFSGTIMGALVVSVLIIGLNRGFLRYFLFGFPVAAIILFQIVQSNEEFQGRYEGTLNIFLDAPQEAFDVLKYHGSSVILYNNFFIAKENFKRNPLFGGGLGSHPTAFKKYTLTSDVGIKGFDLNTKDANSMFNRLMSETGLFGLGLMGYLIFHFFVRRKEEDTEQLWIITGACLVVIFSNLLRQGHYFLNGFPFYVWIYYRAHLERKEQEMSQGLGSGTSSMTKAN